MSDSPEKVRILIVEDSPLEAELLRRILARADFQVVIAQDGEQGLNALHAERIDLVISDIQMPVMSGYELCRAIKQDQKLCVTPVILLSALSEPEDIIEALNVCADSYITKPYVESSLLARIASLLKNPLIGKDVQNRQVKPVEYNGRHYEIATDGQQLLNLLLSVYENAILQNRLLIDTQNQLYMLNQNLNEKVKERTTELQESEQRLLMIFDNMTDGLLLLDDGGRILFENPAAIALFDSPASLLGSAFAHPVVPGQTSELELGSGIPVEMRVTGTIWKGQPVSVVALHDIRLRRQLDQERAQHLIEIKSTLQDLVHALSNAMEKRDPYTSGHQHRVAKLAVAIATELGMKSESLLCVDIAGSLLDIGNIYVPTEILNRPRKLTSLEYELIKGHARAGYDIVKGVRFPWPIATMILQHHERLDGSGYPEGLRADEIIHESRILAVADVVEAMSAYRPYRPAMSIESALDEIRGGRGLRFDAEVVDACLRLFEQKRFSFAPESAPVTASSHE